MRDKACDQPILLCCPHCKSDLIKSENKLSCGNCRLDYPIIDGIPFFSPKDPFYESKFVATKDILTMMPFYGKIDTRIVFFFYRIFIRLSNVMKRERFFHKNLGGDGLNPRNVKILDLGCGGGQNFLKRYGYVAGLDISAGSLKKVIHFYDAAYCSNIFESHFPFRDEQFDYVVSIDFLEHLENDKKDRVLSEIHRVLKKNGRTIHYLVARTDDAFDRFLRSFKESYQRHLIDNTGHVGLEYNDEIADRFARNKFICCAKENVTIYIWILLDYIQFLDNEFRSQSKIIDCIVRFSKFIVANDVLHGIVSCILGPISDLHEYLAPGRHGQGFFICCKKG